MITSWKYYFSAGYVNLLLTNSVSVSNVIFAILNRSKPNVGGYNEDY